MSATFPTRFTGLHDLALLPWFEVREGRLVVVDPEVPEAIDMHTHLALAFVRPMQFDLHRASEQVEHYLPADRALDLDVYQNRNFSPEDLRRMEADLGIGSLRSRGMRATIAATERGVARPVVSPSATCATPSDRNLATSCATTSGSTLPSKGQPKATETVPTRRKRPPASFTISSTFAHCPARVRLRFFCVCASVAETSRLISLTP